MSYQGYGSASGSAGPVPPPQASGSNAGMGGAGNSNIMPPHASSMTLPMTPRSSVPGYIRRASNMPPQMPGSAGARSSSGSFQAGGANSPRAPPLSASLSSLRSGGTYPSAPPGTPHPIGSSYLPSILTSSSSGGNVAGEMPNSAQSRASSVAMAASASKASSAGTAGAQDGVAAAGHGPDVLDRPRDRTKTAEVSSSALAFLFAEMVSYTQNRVLGISDLERKLSLLGYRVGQRVLPLLMHRIEFPTPPSLGSGSSVYNRTPKRETRLLAVLLWLHSQLWKALFGRQADSLERSTEKSDEYMISSNSPLFARSMSVPREMSQLSVESFTAGIIEAALDGMGFPSRVTAHSVATPEHPLRTTILVKLSKEVMEREEALGPA